MKREKSHVSDCERAGQRAVLSSSGSRRSSRSRGGGSRGGSRGRSRECGSTIRVVIPRANHFRPFEQQVSANSLSAFSEWRKLASRSQLPRSGAVLEVHQCSSMLCAPVGVCFISG